MQLFLLNVLTKTYQKEQFYRDRVFTSITSAPMGKKYTIADILVLDVVVARYNQVNVKKKRQMIHLAKIFIGLMTIMQNARRNNFAGHICMKDCRLLRRREHVKRH